MHKGQLPTQLRLRPLEFCGRQRVGDAWAAVMDGLQGILRTRSGHDPGQERDCLCFAFGDFPDAVRAWQEAVTALKRQGRWAKDAGPLPVQALLCQVRDAAGGTDPEVAGVDWEPLHPEALYLTAALVQRWEVLFEQGKDTRFALVEERKVHAYRVELEGVNDRDWLDLFPGRALPLQKGGRPCFYCGLQNHHPSDCPSKHLPPDVHGIARVGYGSLPEFSLNYAKAFSDQGPLQRVIAQGVDSKHLRGHPVLQAYVAYFDLTRVYQLRYLFYLSFCYLEGWPGLGPLNAVKAVGGNTLYLGLDCLRVGNLTQAVGMLRSLEGVNSKHRFSVEVGLAFAALEENMIEAMQEHLKRAEKYAQKSEERVYIGLLTSRFYELFGGSAGLGKALASAYDTVGRCRETEYRILQLSAREGPSNERLQQLSALIQRDRLYFYVALMDPYLVPVRGPVDTLLSSVFQRTLREGREHYERLRRECDALQEWIGSGHRGLETVLTGLASLEERLGQESYFGFTDLVSTSKRLYDSCQGVRERKVAALLRTMDEARRRRGALEQRWHAYPYKRFYKSVPQKLESIRVSNEEATKLLVQEETSAYKEADEVLSRSRASITELENLWPEMAWLWNAFEFGRRFSKRLLVTEAVALALGMFVLPVAGLLSRAEQGVLAGSLLASGNVRRFAFFSLLFFVAPSVALLASLTRRRGS